MVFQIIAGVLLLPPIEEADAAGWYDSGWDYRKKITFTSDSAKIPSTQTDFPVLISATDADLRDSARDDGYDIVFTKSDGTIQLNHEIEKFDGSTGELAAWVEVDSLSTSTEIYLYYGNSDQIETKENISETWDADRNGDLTPDFAMVHHMQENPAGGAMPDGSDEMSDSTSNNNDGNTGGTMTNGDQVSGQIDGSLDFDGSNDYVDCGNDNSLNITGAITVEAWVKPNQQSIDNKSMMVSRPYEVWSQYALGTRFSDAEPYPYFGIFLDMDGYYSVLATSTLTAGRWTHILGTWNGLQQRIYLNGQLNNTRLVGGNIALSSENLRIGSYSSDKYFNGQIDQVCISNTARSAGWIQTEYNNQFSPLTFYVFASEEVLPTIQFTSTSSSGAESLTPANLEIYLSAVSSSNVTVDYTVTGGTATGSGTDYTLVNGTATILAGDTTTTIDAIIIDDNINEPDETIEITISNPTDTTLGANTIHTYTILDNDVEQEEEEEEGQKKEYSSTDGKIYKNLKNTSFSNGEVSYSKEPNPADLISLKITPSFGEIEITIEVWNTSGDYYKKWKEGASSKSITSEHIAGDLRSSESYQVFVDGEFFGTYSSNSSGEISFTYDKGYSEKTFEIKEEIAGAEGLAETGKKAPLIFYLLSLLSAAVGVALYYQTIFKKNKIGD